MEPLRVIATLTGQGYSAADPWSPSLDGILAYWWLREQLGEEEFALGMSGHRALIEPDLPLDRETDGMTWWWVCSAPIVDAAGQFYRHFHRRFDAGEAYDRASLKTKSVLIQGGAFKAYRNRRTVTLADRVEWQCIGDQAKIARLLRRCDGIGFGVTKGYGVVREWIVTRDGADEVVARYHRPLPVETALARGLSGPVLRWGIRPPGRAPEHQFLCMMP